MAEPIKYFPILFQDIILECEKGILESQKAINDRKIIIESYSKTREDCKIGLKILSASTSFQNVVDENTTELLVEYKNNVERLKYDIAASNVDLQRHDQYIMSIAATASTFSDTSNNIRDFLFALNSPPHVTLNSNMPIIDIDDTLHQNGQVIENFLEKTNSQIASIFHDLILEWISKSNPKQKIPLLLNLRTIVFDKIIGQSCQKDEYKTTPWFNDKRFKGLNKIENRVAFFILGYNKLENIADSSIMNILHNSKKLSDIHEKISRTGKLRDLTPSEIIIDTIMRETLSSMVSILKLRNQLHQENKILF